MGSNEYGEAPQSLEEIRSWKDKVSGSVSWEDWRIPHFEIRDKISQEGLRILFFLARGSDADVQIRRIGRAISALGDQKPLTVAVEDSLVSAYGSSQSFYLDSVRPGRQVVTMTLPNTHRYIVITITGTGSDEGQNQAYVSRNIAIPGFINSQTSKVRNS